MPKTEPVKKHTYSQLQCLKWGMMFAPLLLLAPYEAYNLLVVKIKWQEALLDALVVMVGSFALMQVSFSIIFRLYDRIMQQRARLAALHQVDAQLSASLDPQRVLEVVLESVLRLVPAQGARIFIYDPEQEVFTDGWERLVSGECYPIDYRSRPDGFNARVMQACEPLVIEDTAAHPPFFSAEDLARGVKAAAGVPLLHGDQVLGVLSVGFAAPHIFTEDESEILRLLGNRAAVALDNAHQYQRAEAAEARFRDMALSSADWIWEVDGADRYIYCSESVVGVLGYTPAEILGRTPFEFMPPDEAARVGEVFAGIAANKQPIVDLENRNLTKDGGEVVLLTNGVPILDSEGQLLGYRGVDKDITGRKRAEEELIRLSAAVRMSIDSIVLTDVEGKIIEVNEATLEMYGADDKGDLIGKSSFDLVAPEEREKLFACMAEVLEKGYVERLEYYVVTKNDRKRPVETSVTILKDVEGKPIGFVGVTRDITERKRAEEALRESEERYRSLFESVPVGLYRSAPTGEILDANPAILRMLDYPNRESLLAVNATDVHVNVEDRQRWQTLMEREGFVHDYEQQFYRRDGTVIWVEDNAQVIRNQDGSILCYEGAMKDITERKRAEEALRERAEIADSMPDGVLLFDPEGRVVLANQSYCRLMGLERKEVEGKLFMEIPGIEKQKTEELEKYIPLFQEAVDKGSSGPAELTILTRDGREIPVDVNGAVTRDSKGNPVRLIVVIRDITERKRAQEVLRESEERFRAISETAQDSIFIKDRAQRYTQVNPAMERLFGLPASELIGRTDEDLFGAEAGVHVRDVDSCVLDGETIEEEHTKPVKGIPRTFHVIKVPMRARSGEITGLCGIARDVTQRKRAEEELREAKDGLEKQNVHLEALYRVGQMVNSTLETDTILDRLTDEAMRITRATHGQVLVVREESGCFERRSLRGFSPPEAELARTIPLALDRGINGRAYTTRQAACVDDVQADPAYFSLIPTTRTELAVPIIRDGRVLGNLDLQSPEVGAFSDVDLDYLNALADQVAIALENARLYQAEQRGREVAEALQETARVVNTSLNLEQVLPLILEQLAQVIQYDSSAVLLLDDGRFKVTAGRGFPDLEATLRLSFSADEDTLSAAVMHARRPLIIEDAQNDPRWQTGPETAHIHGWIGAPLIVRDEVIGVLTADSCQPGTYSEEDGQLVFIFANHAAVAIENARLYEAVQRELAERKRAEEQLQHYAAELEQANEEVKQFAYIVSHDMRAPLVNLKGFAAELRAGLAVIGSAMVTTLPHLDEKRQPAVTMALQEDVPEALGFIDSSVTRMDHFINALLKLSRLGRRELHLEPVDMNTLVQATLQTLARQIGARKASVTVGRLPEVVADRTAMEQVLGNLLNNAVIYLDPGRPGEIEITAESNPDETTFRVRDNGRGIAQADMDKVFAPFRRAGRQDVPGEGMGLPYVQALIRRHGGRIWVESEPGRGSTFYFTIPANVKRRDLHKSSLPETQQRI